MRVLVVVPGGVAPQRPREIIPVLNDFIMALSTRCDVSVLSISRQARPTYEVSPFRLLNPGRSSRLGKPSLARRSLRMLRRENIGFDIVHSFWLGAPSRVARALRRRAKTGWVAGVGGQELSADYLAALGPLRRRRQQRATRSALAAADAVTAGSRFLLRELLARGVDGHWLPLFPDRNRFRPRPERSRAAAGPFRIISIADHNPAKDPATLLQVVARLESRGHAVHLDWIGLELEPGRAARMARALDIEHSVTIHGHVPHDSISERLADADLYLQSSRYESQGVAVCEGAACGLPVVGTDVGILAEMAPDHALCARVGDVTGLADLVESLILDRGRLRALGRAALEWISNYSTEWSAERAVQIYTDVLDARSRRA